MPFSLIPVEARVLLADGRDGDAVSRTVRDAARRGVRACTHGPWQCFLVNAHASTGDLQYFEMSPAQGACTGARARACVCVSV